MAERLEDEPDRRSWEPLQWREQTKVCLLAGILGVEIIGSGIALIVWIPSTSSDGHMNLFGVLRWICIAGLFGGAARALLYLKIEFGARGEHPPRWYLDKWPLYLAKPFLGVAGALASYLAGRIAFEESFNTDDLGAVQARTLLTALAGGMFFEGAFERLKDLIPEAPRPRPAEPGRPADDSPK